MLIWQTNVINFKRTSYTLLWRDNWFGQVPEETTQCSTKLMQLNYSYLKTLKLKINSLFSHTFLCPLRHSGFFSPFSLLTQNPQFLPLVSLKSPLDWPKIRHGLLLQNNQIVNNWTISIGMIWYLPIVNLLSCQHVFVNDSPSVTVFYTVLMLCIWLHRIRF